MIKMPTKITVYWLRRLILTGFRTEVFTLQSHTFWMTDRYGADIIAYEIMSML